MKTVLLAIGMVFAIACASEKPPTFPADQAVGLTDEQGSAMVEAMKGKGGLLYGQNYFYNLNTPDGWVLDNSAGVSQGLDAVFYEKGGSWAESTTIMYPQVWQKEGKSLQAILDDDIAKYKESFPSLQVTDLPDIMTKKGQRAVVKHFEGGARNQYEAIAYFDEPKVIIMVVFQAVKKDQYEKWFPAFRGLVESYVYFGEKSPFGQGG
jgi:hypothetical protein